MTWLYLHICIVNAWHFKIVLISDKIGSTSTLTCGYAGVVSSYRFAYHLYVWWQILLKRGVVESRVGRISKTWIIHMLTSVLNCVKFIPDPSWELSRLLPHWWPLVWLHQFLHLLHLCRRTKWKFHNMLNILNHLVNYRKNSLFIFCTQTFFHYDTNMGNIGCCLSTTFI